MKKRGRKIAYEGEKSQSPSQVRKCCVVVSIKKKKKKRVHLRGRHRAKSRRIPSGGISRSAR